MSLPLKKEVIEGLRERFPDFIRDMEKVIRCDWTATPYIHQCYDILWSLVIVAEKNRQTLPEPNYYFASDDYPVLEWEIGEEKLVIVSEDQTIRLNLYEKGQEKDLEWAANSLLVKKFFNWE